MTLFDALGFRWDRSVVPTYVPSHSVKLACFRFKEMLPEFVWDASFLEGNPFTLLEVKTLLDGVTTGGRKVSDQEQVLTGCGKSSKLEGFPSLLAGLARNWGRFLRVPPALTAKIVPSGPFWTDSGPRYAAAPSSFGIRTRL